MHSLPAPECGLPAMRINLLAPCFDQPLHPANDGGIKWLGRLEGSNEVCPRGRRGRPSSLVVAELVTQMCLLFRHQAQGGLQHIIAGSGCHSFVAVLGAKDMLRGLPVRLAGLGDALQGHRG